MILGAHVLMSGEQIPTPPERSESVEQKRPQKKQKRVSANRDHSKSRVINAIPSTSDDYSIAISVEATAYTAECTGCIGITKTGVDVRNTTHHKGKRVIAVDPKVVPLESTVKLTFKDGSTMTAIAVDTGGAIKGHRIDILMSTTEQALEFGRQNVKLTILN